MDRSPRLSWSEAGAPLSGRFNDVYFSREDGLAEARAVFLEGCGLPDAWTGRRHFVVGELGFGTGLNIAALLDLWRRTRPADGRLHVFSVEGYPLTREQAGRALAAWPALSGTVERLLAEWPEPTPGFHRLAWPDLGVTLDLAVGEVLDRLKAWAGRADAWFLDGFAPSANPDMWSASVLDLIAEKSAPTARVATFTVAGEVRRGLAARGFTVAKKPGHGRKRERLEAVRAGSVQSERAPRVVVIGAGVAGASVVRALADQGIASTVVERDAMGAGASGFPAALVTPRLDAGDQEIAALHAQALRRAGNLYRAVDAVTQQGVLQLASAPRDIARFAKIAEQPWWSDGAMQVLDATACAALVGEPVDCGGVMMNEALTIRPTAALSAWLSATEIRRHEAAKIENVDGEWRVLSVENAVLARADAVVLAGGWGVAQLAPGLPLAPVRGQADWAAGPTPPSVAWGGYIASMADGVLFGATHDRGEAVAEVSDAASARNHQALAARLPRLAQRVEGRTQARAAVRATTPDRLPLAGEIEGRPGLFVIGGLGSRGFCLAPLLGEHLAALISGAPSPLPRPLSARIDPGRFLARNRLDR